MEEREMLSKNPLLIVLAVVFLTVGIPSYGASEEPRWPGVTEDGYFLPNGWKLTPPEKSVPTEDLPLNLVNAPDGKAMVAVHGGYNRHGLVVMKSKSGELVQEISVPTAGMGLAWHPNGKKLYVAGANSKRKDKRAPVYVFGYRDGRLSETPVTTFTDDQPVDPSELLWWGLAHHPNKDLLYAANRTAGTVVAFDSSNGKLLNRTPVETNPCEIVASPDGGRLYVSNWGSASISVIDTANMQVAQTIPVRDNPGAMVLARDGRLFVCCANENLVVVVDTAQLKSVESIATSMYENAPEGTTPNALALDPEQATLYVANADNNNVCVIDVKEKGENTVLGFIPSGWYPSAIGVDPRNRVLFIGNAKGNASYSDIYGPGSPLPPGKEGRGTVKSLMKGSISIVDIQECRQKLRTLTQRAYANCPYNNDLLKEARPAKEPSVVPSAVGAGSKIKHVLYIIQENRTYDQVFGDMGKGNGDPRLCIFGREVTPNRHAIVDQFVLLDNIYCDAEVSVDGHQWSNAAYATDYIEKTWPASYGDKSAAPYTTASLPTAGYIWDQCAKKGLTFRSYGELAERVSEGKAMEALPRIKGLKGHIAPYYGIRGDRDPGRAAEFIREFDEYEKNYDNPDPEKRLPNFIVMSLPEDHTSGTRPGAPTPRAAVASSDYALGMIVDRVSHSRYWPETAIFTIQDDAQDGPDHVDARRTVGLAIGPYCKRGALDSTFYTTSAMLRTIELLLGLPPMSQFDAAATPMYASFGDTPDLAPYTHLKPTVDVNELNQPTAWGARESLAMNLDEIDLAPMFELNEIIWKSVRGADSEMPLPVHRFQSASLRGK